MIEDKTSRFEDTQKAAAEFCVARGLDPSLIDFADFGNFLACLNPDDPTKLVAAGVRRGDKFVEAVWKDGEYVPKDSESNWP